MVNQYLKAGLFVFISAIATLVFISCDSEIDGCFGVNLERSSCPSQTILAIGQQDGLSCIKCTGQETGDRFSIDWVVAVLEGTPNPGTIFSFLNTSALWLAEFSDCETMNLFETSQNQLGRFVKGEFAGTLEDIRPFQIDKLSLFINIPGVRVENATCNFCSDSIPPRCFEVITFD
ncbi:MAG: hypothetical protein RIG61_07325 [Deltaproteobacteria bacterium]